MPSYYRLHNYAGYSIKIAPLGWRRFFPRALYFVGDRIKLKFTFERLGNTDGGFRFHDGAIWVIHPNKSLKEKHLLGKADLNNKRFTFELESAPIMSQGEYTIYLGN